MSDIPDSNYEYQVGGSLPFNAPTYVTRQADDELFNKLKAGEFCYVLNSRQMGKSSLRVRTMQRLQAEEIACAGIDITAIGTQGVTPDQWYAGVIELLATSLKLDKFNMDIWWKNQKLLPPVQRLSKFIEEELLSSIYKKIVIFVDEIDSVLSLTFSTEDFFALIRFCYNQRAEKPEYKRLTFCLLGVATPSDLIQDKQRTPFNIGQAIELKGFSENEAKSLAQGLDGKVSEPQKKLKEVLEWTGGQPFLSQKLCKLILDDKQRLSVEKLVRSGVIENWQSQDDPEHLRTISNRILINKHAERLLRLYQQILQKKEIGEDNSPEQMELRLSGLVVKQNGKLRVYNRIYESVFDHNWINQTLANLRPYTKELAAWLNSNSQDKSHLLRGQKLREAQKWQKGKELLVQDYQFLNASQELATRKQQRLLSVLTPILLLLIPVLGWLYWSSFVTNQSPPQPPRQEPLEPQQSISAFFSQGEHTLFSGNENVNRERGSEAFRKKDYKQAVKYFQSAIEAFPYDPELQIFYNNAKAHEKGNPVTLAIVLPIATRREISQELLRGVAQAQDGFNSSDAENTRLLNIVIADDKNEPTQSQKIAQKLAKDQKVLGVIGHYTSTNSQAALPEYEKAGLAMIAQSTSTSLSGLKNKVFFRAVPSDKEMATKLADYANQKGYQKVIIFYNQGDIYSQSLKKEFEQSFKGRGGKVVENIDLALPTLNTSNKDFFSTYLNKADGVVLFPKTQSISVALEIARAQLKNLGSKKLPLLGGDALYDPEILKSGREAVEDLVLAIPWFAEAENSKKFAGQARDKWGGQISWRTAATYDATQAFIQALSMSKSSNLSRQTVLKNLKSLKISQQDTAGYPLQFDQEGERKQEPALVKVVRGSGGPQESGFKFEHVK
ncbi:AAA-like domain-containing protein [Scytonema sp. UIC 10036]|uniref:AAA-like domain-containing protein n=1 Tax=Scytonema sp. UIC 10036 TaxID=2304196 RepID=UPI00140FB331|nr:AAA-like domain-containing protein [Scytonema sp. UIC 10036]